MIKLQEYNLQSRKIRMGYVKTLGVVIKEVNTGEADKVITVFSGSCGKISAYARGARRPKSKLASGTQILGYCEYVLFKGRDMYSVNSCDVIEPFYEIRNDVVKLTYAAHFLDIISDMVQENQASNRMLQLLLNSLHMLAKTDKQPELIARIFELRSLSIAGYAPYAKGCIECGDENPDGCSFSFRKCGLLCGREACRESDRYAMELSQGALKALQHIVYSKTKTLFSFSLSPQVLEELDRLNRRYMREQLERDFTKLDFLKSI